MFMDFIINKNQLGFLLESEQKFRLSDNMKELYSFLVKICNKIERKYGINIKMLLTWGPAVAGLVMPLDNFLRNSEFSLNDDQIALVIVSALFLVFFENRKTTSKLKQSIEQQELDVPLQVAVGKLTELRNSFSRFLKSSGILVNNLSEVVSYSFLIPVIQDIQNIIHTGTIEESVAMIVKRLIASGLIMIGGEILHETMKKIAKKIT